MTQPIFSTANFTYRPETREYVAFVTDLESTPGPEPIMLKSDASGISQEFYYKGARINAEGEVECVWYRNSYLNLGVTIYND